MHAAERAALPVVGHIALNHPRIQAVLLELAPAVAAGEESAFVLVRRELDLEDAFQVFLSENHEW